MDGKDLTAFDEPRLQCDTKTLDLTRTSDVLRKFDQDTTLVASVALSLIIVAAAALGCQELVQTESLRLSGAATGGATDQPHVTQLTWSTPSETSYRSDETTAPNPSSPRAPSSQSNPTDTEITTSHRSAEPAEELAEPELKSPKHRAFMHHKVADAKIRLLMLWHVSLSRSRQQAHRCKAFWAFNELHWRAND